MPIEDGREGDGGSFEIKKDIGGFISDHCCIKNSKVIAVTDDGWILLIEYDSDSKTSNILNKLKISLDNEHCVTLAIHQQTMTIAVHTSEIQTSNQDQPLPSTIFIFQMENISQRIYQVDQLSVRMFNVMNFDAMIWYDYVFPQDSNGDNKLILTTFGYGLTNPNLSQYRGNNGQLFYSKMNILTFIFNGKKLGHLSSQNRVLNCRRVWKAVLIEDGVIGAIDGSGNMIKVWYEF